MSTDVLDLLASSPVFGSLGHEELEVLATRFSPISAPGGSTLMTEGEAGDGLYLLTAGRLRAYVSIGEAPSPVGDIGPGELVGEMALLSDEPRSATVRALRDSDLLFMSRADFEDLVASHGAVLMAVTRLLVDRLRDAIRGVRREPAAKTVAVIPLDPAVDVGGLADALARDLDDRAIIIAESAGGSSLPTDLHVVEASHDLVIYLGNLEDEEWTRRCVRQADRVLLVADATADPGQRPIERILGEIEPSVAPAVDLALVHSRGGFPSGTSRWLEPRNVGRHFHVRADNQNDVSRVARFLTGKAVGVVFSGGGARGFAHFGVYRALQEAGVPVDAIAGTSFGSAIGVLLAMDLSYEAAIDSLRRTTVDSGSLIDFTFPAAALSKGTKISDRLRSELGDVAIEDLWLPFLCVSSDLTIGEERIHTSGAAWRAVRSSVAIPGIFPPMTSVDGHVLVDGGVIDNLPVDPMVRTMDVGSVIAIDVRARTDFSAENLADDGALSGWQVAFKRLNPFSESMSVPRMVDVLLRSTEVASADPEAEPDFVFRPPVQDFQVLEFKSWEAITDVGYRHAFERMEEWEGEGRRLPKG
ncbi:MAG: patatin-like phospholipase family protein [Acidimicrobiia bacterium]|nr:patatin-like phospholipase family protein [Acidimicrobiia bacterium]